VDLKHIDRQFPFDDVEVVQDRFGRVKRKSDNVASVNEDARFLPLQQHPAIFGDLVLLLFRSQQIGRVDVLQPDIRLLDARPPALRDKVRQFVTHRVHLDDETEVHLLDFSQMNQAIEDDPPVFVPSEIVIRDEESEDPLCHVASNDLLYIVRRTPTRCAPLHVNDSAERALIRAASPGIEARRRPPGAFEAFALENWKRRAIDARQVIHVIV
jgi:hypothetical protein